MDTALKILVQNSPILICLTYFFYRKTNNPLKKTLFIIIPLIYYIFFKYNLNYEDFYYDEDFEMFLIFATNVVIVFFVFLIYVKNYNTSADDDKIKKRASYCFKKYIFVDYETFYEIVRVIKEEKNNEIPFEDKKYITDIRDERFEEDRIFREVVKTFLLNKVHPKLEEYYNKNKVESPFINVFDLLVNYSIQKHCFLDWGNGIVPHNFNETIDEMYKKAVELDKKFWSRF